ncbi:MAG TPA: response regulator [Fibrobacteria bacterium]|nr:response regulator [Fibrobacteria bacterium]
MTLRKDPILWLALVALCVGIAAAVASGALLLEVVFRSLCSAAGLAGSVLIWRNRRGLPDKERGALRLLSLSTAAWAIGIGVHLVDLGAGNLARTYPPADVFFVFAAVVGVVGMARLPTGPAEPGARKVMLIDQAIAALSSGGVFWHLVLTPNIGGWAEWSGPRLALTLLYPMLEFVILQMAIDLLVRGPSRKELDVGYRWAAVGIVSLLAGSVFVEFGYWREHGLERHLLHFTNLGFGLAMLLAGNALGRNRSALGKAPSAGWLALRESLVPLAWVALPSFAYAWILLLGGGEASWDLLAVLCVLVVLVVARQRIAEKRLVSNLRSALLASLLPVTLGFQLVAMVVVCLILSVAFQKAASRSALMETMRMAQSPASLWSERTGGGPRLEREARWILVDDAVPALPESFGFLIDREMGRIRSEETGTAIGLPGDALLPDLVTWARLPGGSRRTLVVVSPMKNHLAEAQFAGAGIIALFLLGAIATAWMIFLKARSLARPLEKLTTVASEVENGDLSVRTGVSGTDEMGRLGRAMDSMLDRLGQTLREQREMAEQAKEASLAKSRFLANMSHEIRTPLNGVLGMADLLSTSQLDFQEKELVAHLKTSAESLRNLVGDILDLSKIEAERVTLEFAPFSPRDLLDEVVALFEPLARAKGLVLSCRWTSPPPPGMMGDSARVRQILSNIVSNALKFTSRGEVALRAGRSESPSPTLVVEVEDTGTGVAPESRDRIWQVFSQADESTTRRFGGTGLGLSISRSLARLMGGDLFLARSEPGEGSVFVFRTPLFETDEPGSSVADSSHGQTGDRPIGLRVLVAEDNLVNQKVTVGFLRKLGCKTILVEDGEAAVEVAMRERPDMVLMDVHMPRMDGLEASKALRNAGYQGRIWALTASALGEERERCLDAGMDGFLAKPIGLADLRSMLLKVFATPD